LTAKTYVSATMMIEKSLAPIVNLPIKMLTMLVAAATTSMSVIIDEKISSVKRVTLLIRQHTSSNE